MESIETIKVTKVSAPKTRRKKTSKTSAPKINLGIYKMHDDSPEPIWATSGSACFDLKAYLPAGEMVMVFDKNNLQRVVRSKVLAAQNRECISLFPGDRALIPTGLVFDIPYGYDIRVHPRSGVSWKQGLTLSNCEGVIDNDYVEQLYVSIINVSHVKVNIGNNDRIAQAELTEGLQSDKIEIQILASKPKQKTKRSGGFGHTGV